jgi:sec-independent protein translocase protein TatA
MVAMRYAPCWCPIDVAKREVCRTADEIEITWEFAMQVGPLQIILVLLLAVLLFGRGKLSGLMTDLAQGIKGFRKGLQEEEPAAAPKVDDAKTIEVNVNTKETTNS